MYGIVEETLTTIIKYIIFKYYIFSLAVRLTSADH